jgi:glutaredoxin
MYYMISGKDCSWCDKAKEHIEKELKETLAVSYYNDNPIIKKLMARSGLRTVPQIWKDDEYIGGYKELISSE